MEAQCQVGKENIRVKLWIDGTVFCENVIENGQYLVRERFKERCPKKGTPAPPIVGLWLNGWIERLQVCNNLRINDGAFAITAYYVCGQNSTRDRVKYHDVILQ
jgi:hypothetical protein